MRTIFLMLVAVMGWGQEAAQGPYLVKPYLQLGDAPAAVQSKEQMLVMWHTADEDRKWEVEYRGKGEWKAAKVEVLRKAAGGKVAVHRVYGAKLEGLTPGAEHEYRVKVDGAESFTARFRARKAAGTATRFVVFGDCAAGTSEQKAVAYQTYLQKPDFVAIAGDIVYSRGLMSEYREKYWPIYNADEAKAEKGAPLIRGTLFMGAAGNHDVGGMDLGKNPDGMAYFLYWAQPLNGPLAKAADVGATPLSGDAGNFLAAAGAQFPRMANYSFEYGDTHWTVLDSNKYVDWNTPALLEWLKKDLAAAQKAKWRFVIYHHPGFNSSKAHFGDQWMRLLAPVFEAGKVDIVFAGHVHNYQRSHPLTFAPESGKWQAKVDGKWTLDKRYDGAKQTKPRGVLYLVTGAGGARLYNPEQEVDRAGWQEFTAKFVSTVNSLTVVDADGGKLVVKQIDAKGMEVDRFTVTR